LRRGEPPRVFEDGGQRRDFVHVRDVASAIEAAVLRTSEEEQPGLSAYNVGSGVVHTIGDLAWALAASWGGDEPIVTGEYRLGDVRHVTASSALIADRLGWRATVPFEDGIRELATLWREAVESVSEP
jgi:dTDP-L-rhamnose 4-epimerase